MRSTTVHGGLGIRSRLRAGADRVRHRNRALPDFLILGAAKAGTTSLFDHICDLPGIEPPTQKEIHYFSQHVNARHYEVEGPGWYRSHFPSRRHLESTGRITGEASPRYMVEPLAMERITRDLPQSRWIVVLREPVDRAYSHHQDQVRRGKESRSFDEAIAQQFEMLDRRPLTATDRDAATYIGGGRYVEQLDVIRRYRPDTPTLVLFCENLFDGHEPSFALLHEFLGQPAPTSASLPRLNAASTRSVPDQDTARRLAEHYAEFNAGLDDRLRSRSFVTVDESSWPTWVLAGS